VRNVPREELVTLLTQLTQSIANHDYWYQSLVRVLICHLPADADDLHAQAHRRCLFGRWYYALSPVRLREQPAFMAVEEEHRVMHARARHLLSSASRGEVISTADYDSFAASMDSMRLHLLTLKSEVEDHLHNRDPLTGARSRIGMYTKLREQQELIRRHVHECSIAMLDLDRFKSVNDRYGHQAGDRVLIDTVHYLLDHLRPYDAVYRYGGEEFVICMQNLALKPAESLVERLREDLSDRPVMLDDGTRVQRTVSIGITLLDPDERVEISIDRADRAMYAAKEAGRNRTRVWDVSMSRNSFEGPLI
jgi:diguanylate cyclase (GGDEF)-like protein